VKAQEAETDLPRAEEIPQPWNWERVTERIKGLAGSWPSYTLLGTALLYLLGYLSLRFHLTALGVGADLTVADERYLFTGARFVVYLLTSLANLALVLAPVLLVISVIHSRRGVLPVSDGHRTRSVRQTPTGSRSSTAPLLFAGSALASTLLIQLVMRKCFLFSDLLLASELPGPKCLAAVLLDRPRGLKELHFTVLVAGCLLTGGLFYLGCARARASAPSPLPQALAGALLVLALLFLPINYGIFILDKRVPRVPSLGTRVPLAPGQAAWIVWPGNEYITYLVRSTGKKGTAAQQSWSLLSIPQKETQRIKIMRYDHVFRIRFSPLDSLR
jgi:hypothetical protein